MRMKLFSSMMGLCILSSPVGCSTTDSNDADADADTDTSDDTDADTDTDTDSDTDTDTDTDSDSDSDADTDSSETIPNEWGLPIVLPGSRQITCTGGDYWEDETVDFPDADWLCTFSHAGVEGVIYARSAAIDCVWLMSQVPIFESRGAWISIDGTVTALSDVAYDAGGNHANNSLEFNYADLRFRYFHSSFGFGWRACNPMDCLQVEDPAGTVIEDGCTCDRTLPAVCVRISPDGEWDTFADTFAVCPGDSVCAVITP